MRLVLVLCVMAAVVLGCGRLSGDDKAGGNTAANAGTSPAPVEKFVDLTALQGKSVDEVNKALGQNEKERSGMVNYQLPKGKLLVQYNKGKQVMLGFKIDPIMVDGMSFTGYPTAAWLGQAVGLDIKGTPSSSEYQDKYYDFMVNGQKCELTVGKLLEAYNEASLYCP